MKYVLTITLSDTEGENPESFAAIYESHEKVMAIKERFCKEKCPYPEMVNFEKSSFLEDEARIVLKNGSYVRFTVAQLIES